MNDRIKNKFYISALYNYMIKKQKKVGIFHVPNEQHNPIGTTQDFKNYIDKISDRVK